MGSRKAKEGSVDNAAQSNMRNVGIGRRTTSIAATAVLASLLSALAPTGAAAFDIGGLIGTAMALQIGQYRAPSYHHSRDRVASRHDRSSDDDGTTVERDARDVELPAKAGSSQGGSEKSHQPAPVPHGITAQASERDAAAGQTVSSDRTGGDAPAFAPSR
jgi:hypothetical protein